MRFPQQLPLVLLALLCNCDSTVAIRCGEPGRANFNDASLPRGVYGELYSAVRCYYNQSSFCRSINLAAPARGPNATNVQQYYGRRISRWCTGLVTKFDYTFANMPTFNEPLYWKTTSATSFRSMFANALAYNHLTVGLLDTSSAQDFSSMFSGALAFDQSLSAWNTSRARTLDRMFQDAVSFNSPVNTWDVSNVESMMAIFDGATSFQQELGAWNVRKVDDFTSALARTRFNADLSAWMTDSACHFDGMFRNASQFSQDLNQWQARLINGQTCRGGTNPVTMANMFQGTRCPVQTERMDQPFCRPRFSLRVCLTQAFQNLDCDCTKPTRCLKSLRTNTTACETKYAIAGKDPVSYKRRVERFFADVCIETAV